MTLPTLHRRTSRALGAVALALALSACTSDAEKVAEHMATADRYVEQDDLRSALVELQAALKLEPKNADLNERIAEVLAGLGRPERAAFFFGETYRLDPTRTDAALAQAAAFYGSDLDAAEALVKEVLEKAPDSARAHASWAEIRLLRSDATGALAAALTATELGPENAFAHRMVASVQRSLIREDALLGKPPDPQVYEAALAACERAATLSKDQESTGPWYDRMQQALIYADWPGHEEQARTTIQDAFRMADESDQQPGRLTVTREARRIAAAHNDPAFTRWAVERWVETEPGSIRAWALLASIEISEGRSGDAVWQQAFAARPEDMVLHAGYVRALADEGRMADALAHLDGLPPAVREGPEAFALRAEMAIRERDVAAAQKVLAGLRAQHPGSPLTRLTDARIAAMENRLADALTILRGLSGEVERADVLRDLAQMEAAMGNLDAALAAAERAIQLQPSRSPMPYAVRMRVLARKGDWPGVLRTWRELRFQALPIEPSLEALRIQALYESGRDVPARRLLEQAVSVPEPDLAMLIVFYRYEGKNQPERSRQLLADGARRFPIDQRMAEAQILTELDAGNEEAALARLDEYDRRTGVNSLPALRAQILWGLGRKDEAEASARLAFGLKPRPPEVTQLLLGMLSERGKIDEAVRLLEQGRSAGDLGSADLWQLGSLYLGRGDLDRAREALEEAAKDPSQHAARNDLAYVLALSGQDLDRAVELARAAKSAMPDDPAVTDTLGFTYLKKGLFEPAVSEFRSAIEQARLRGQQVADFHYHLGLALQGLGRSAEARQAFDEALRIEPGHQAAQQARSQVPAGADAS